jgi:hypothetical protein
MVTVWNARKSQTRVSPLARPGGEKPSHSGRMVCWQGVFCQASTFDTGLQFKKNSFFDRAKPGCY